MSGYRCFLVFLIKMIQSKRTLEKSPTLFKIQQFGPVINFEQQSLQWIKTKNTEDFCLEYLCG